jgi:hypothetical protein
MLQQSAFPQTHCAELIEIILNLLVCVTFWHIYQYYEVDILSEPNCCYAEIQIEVAFSRQIDGWGK